MLQTYYGGPHGGLTNDYTYGETPVYSKDESNWRFNPKTGEVENINLQPIELGTEETNPNAQF